MPTSHLPIQLFRAEQVREMDRLAIRGHGIPGIVLMERAGAAVFRVLRARWPRARRIGVLCGVGNNGGDGFVVARLAAAAGLQVDAWQVGDGQRQAGDALTARARLEASGNEVRPLDPARLTDADVLVDALLGTGLKGAVRGEWADVIAGLNGAGRPVVAVDIPSGLEADTGAAAGVAVRADATVTFIGVKQGLVTGSGVACCGRLVFDDLGVPVEVRSALQPAARLLAAGGGPGFLAPRPRDAHKGAFGHVLVAGGAPGMSGAARMAAEAAARVGAGLVSVATHPDHAGYLGAGRPELMVRGVGGAADLETLLARASVVVLGPGLGRDAWSEEIFAASLAVDKPLVVDADGLNLLAVRPRHRGDWVLTPHPAEAGRLLESDAPGIQSDRFGAARAIAERYGGVCVLKGAGTLIDSGDSAPWVCRGGNPGMASGGMGDILSGVIGGLRAQGLPPEIAARQGVRMHAEAADAVAFRQGERGLLACDLLPALQRLANPAGTP